MAYARKAKNMRRFRLRRRRGGIKKMVKALINKNIENKYLGVDISNSTGTLGALQLVNQIAAGTGSNQRVGNSVRITSVRWKGYWTANDATNIVRMMVLWSRAPLQIGLMPGVYQPINPATQSFKVLFDYSAKLESIASSGIVQALFNKTIYRRIGGFTRYADATGSSVQSGYLYTYFVSDSAAVGHPSFLGNMWVSYQDA